VPTLIITAQDDPFIPYGGFELPALRTNRWIRLVAPTHGGHCGFLQHPRRDEDIYWAENRLVEFARDNQ
jgi:predicted alpha/beta-fold hydrolase